MQQHKLHLELSCHNPIAACTTRHFSVCQLSRLRVEHGFKQLVTRQRHTACRAQPWRPHIDDVDRLSAGEAAKVKGTGHRDIPHRLNAEERPVYESAKRKGYLAVRGTGYRRDRKGSPLPNVYRQWCDARGMAAIVIEQDRQGGAQPDCVVIDFSPLRLSHQDLGRAQALATQVAAQHGLRPLPPSERPPEAVPFDTLPQAPLLASAPQARRQAQRLAPSSRTGGMREGSSGAGRQAAQPSTLGDDASPTTSSLAQHSSQSNQARDAQAAVLDLQRQVSECAQQVRALKEGAGLSNSDPQVQELVAHLKRLKAELSQAEEAAGRLQRPLSGRAAALFEAFPAPEQPAPGSQAHEPTQAGGSGSTSTEAAAVGSPHTASTGIGSSQAAALDVQAPSKAHQQDLVQGEAVEPRMFAAIWALPPAALFFPADRSQAKVFAKAAAEVLRVESLSRSTKLRDMQTSPVV